MIRYTRADYPSGKDTLCYVTEDQVSSVTVECVTPDKDRLDFSLHRMSPHLYVLDIDFNRPGNYIMSLKVDGTLVHVLNARVSP